MPRWHTAGTGRRTCGRSIEPGAVLISSVILIRRPSLTGLASEGKSCFVSGFGMADRSTRGQPVLVHDVMNFVAGDVFGKSFDVGGIRTRSAESRPARWSGSKAFCANQKVDREPTHITRQHDEIDSFWPIPSYEDDNAELPDSLRTHSCRWDRGSVRLGQLTASLIQEPVSRAASLSCRVPRISGSKCGAPDV